MSIVVYRDTVLVDDLMLWYIRLSIHIKISFIMSGLSHLQVDDLKDLLAAQEVELAQKNADANELIQIVGAESEKVGKEKAIADAEEAKVSKI